jgi:hypothetical protein
MGLLIASILVGFGRTLTSSILLDVLYGVHTYRIRSLLL